MLMVFNLLSLQKHKTPLHDAVDKKKISTVKCIVEELKMDISKFDEVQYDILLYLEKFVIVNNLCRQLFIR